MNFTVKNVAKLIVNVRHSLLIRHFCDQKKTVVFSGIQPTGCVHIGNYFGAIKQWVDLHKDSSKKCIFSVVDLHSITMKHDPDELKRNIKLLTACLLASGLEPEKCIIFQQSSVPHHTLLSWLLGCMTTMSRLTHLPQYKEKSESMKTIPFGLYVYPILQTADILLYKAEEVPIGEDQLPHLQFAQELCRKFNNKYKELFPVPRPLTNQDLLSRRIKSLRDPTKKMSKSEVNVKSRIDIIDEPDVIVEKLKKAVTDLNGRVTFSPDERPGVSNLINIHSLVTGLSVDVICEQSTHINTGQYKLLLADLLVEHFSPIRQKVNQLLEDNLHIEKVLKNGAFEANELASETVDEVKQVLGFR